MTSIPQSNPKANYLAHKTGIDAAVARVLESGWYILGNEVSAFERDVAAYIGVRYAIGVASGTDALHLALRACGVGREDAVLTVSHTAVATVAAIGICGAHPIFVDIDPGTFTMDPDHLESTIRSAPKGLLKAVVPVHLYGHPADMDAIREIAERHGLHVVEDCAQSLGAMYRGKKTGALGQLAAFSFYPTKNLGALGDGGMVVTDDPDLAEKVRLLREYGWKERYVSATAGVNSRLDEIQAAILHVKLPFLDEENRFRRMIAGIYNRLLSGSPLILPTAKQDATHVYHQYVIRTEERDVLRTRLRDKGIGTLVHYPIPVHRQPAYARRPSWERPLAGTEEIATQILSLPMFPELSPSNAETVAFEIGSWCRD